MQQGGSQYGMSPEMTRTQHILGVSTSDQLQQQQQQLLHQQRSSDTTAAVVAEGASPISSRAPPVGARSSGNLDELVAVSSGGFPDDDGIGGDEMERGVLSGGNRWPRQETIALLKIRSEMDAAFRDATLKGPLWDDVSRKLAELGYVRSAKKCKEKFENVHKYYKRTKEGRAGRQDGKSYRFFSQLEALHTTTTTTTTTATTTTTTPIPPAVVPVSMGIGTVIATSGRIQPNSETATPNAPMTQIGLPRMNPLDLSGGVQIGVSGSASAAVGSAFSSDTSSDYSDSDDELEGEPSNTNTRKRKRGESSSNRKMMGFFEGLMKQVIERQEAMQQRFLEMIEKRDQDRMIREEAWKHQEMVRLNREHEIIAHEREISATRDAAIIAFLQKITGQSIQLPPSVAIPPTAPPQSTPPPPPPPQPQQQHYQQQQKKEIIRHQPTTTDLVVAAIPEQQHPPQEMGGGGGGSLDQSSSRWPKAEVLALISLRSGLDSRYQDAGPKGPLWEEISAGMHRMGYNRSSKRCKEKWENINKYFKKVKESNKKRPEDAKTCPYFHQLDDLYRKKMLGGVGSSSFVNQNNEQQQLDSSTNDSNPTANLQVIMAPPPPPPPETNEAENKNIDDNNGGSIEVKKPEDIMMEHHPQHSVMDFYEKLEDSNRDNRDHEEEEVMEDDEEETEEEEEERKMGYKIQFQRPNAGSSNGGGNTGGSPFMAMVK